MRRPSLRLHPLAIRGTNYLPSSTLGTDTVLGWYPQTAGAYEPLASGFFSAPHNDQELAQIVRFGLNNIRLFPSFWSWVIDPAKYMATLRAIAANCARHRLTITYAVWNTTGSLGFDPAQALTDLVDVLAPGLPNPRVRDRLIGLVLGSVLSFPRRDVIPPGEPWHGGVIDEPGNSLFDRPIRAWPDVMREAVNLYLRDVATFFATDANGSYVFQSYDLFNEPEAAYGEDDMRKPNVFEFVELSRDIIRTAHADAQFTVGWAGIVPADVAALHQRVGADYLSSHLYRTPADLARDVIWIRDMAAAVGLPYVVSEFWERRLDPTRPHAAPLAPHLEILAAAGVGGQMWGFIESNVFDSNDAAITGVEVDGIVQPKRGQWVPTLSPKGFPLATPWPTEPLRFRDNLPSAGDASALRAWTRRDADGGS